MSEFVYYLALSALAISSYFGVKFILKELKDSFDGDQ
jgi:hypothetical protein